jgi:hypothetical protein
MNSLPLISHHLFVAAIGNEGRDRDRPGRPANPSLGFEDYSIDITLDVVDEAGAPGREGIHHSWAAGSESEI